MSIIDYKRKERRKKEKRVTNSYCNDVFFKISYQSVKKILLFDCFIVFLTIKIFLFLIFFYTTNEIFVRNVNNNF